MRCPLSTWRKKGVEVEFFCSGRCLPWLHYGHQLRCNCEDVWSADGALFLRYCICPFPCCPFPCFVASTSPAEFGSPFFPLFCQACHRCRPPLNPKLSSLSGSCLQCPYMRGATKCVGQRHGVRWWAAQGAWSDGSLGLKGTDGQGQAEKVDLWLQSKDHSISLRRILLRLA